MNAEKLHLVENLVKALKAEETRFMKVYSNKSVLSREDKDYAIALLETESFENIFS